MTTTPSAPVRLLLARLEAVRQDGTGWSASCPAHDDTRNSLHVAEGEGGRAVLHCHAGCATEDVVKAAGTTMETLFQAKGPPRTREIVHGRFDEAAVVATYDYVDETGALLFQVQRDAMKNFRQRRPDPAADPGEPAWIYNVQGVPRTPYRLPEVKSAIAFGIPIHVVEGEKDADALAALGLVATTNAGGAGKWSNEHSAALAGAKAAFIVPDNDQPGTAHARLVRKSLRKTGIQARIVRLPGVPEKGDASDWIAQGHTRTELEALCAIAPTLDQEWVGAAGLIQRDAPDVPWLVEGFLTRDGTAILSGESATFKSWTLVAWLLALSTGTRFLGRFDCPESRVLFVNADEEEGETRRKLKFLAAGARMENGELELADQNLKIRSGYATLTDPEELAALADAVSDFEPDLVAIDSASAVIEGEENNREFARSARAIVAALRAERDPLSVLFVHEWNKPSKDGGRRPGDRLRGTGSLRYLITQHLALECSPDDIVTFKVDKQRRGRKIPPFDYVVRIAESEGLAVLEYHGDARDRTGTSGATKAVLEWLTASPGRHLQSELIKALCDKHPDRTVKNAVTTLESGHTPKIGTDRSNARKTYVWLLGTATVQTSTENVGQSANVGQIEHGRHE